MAHAQDPPGGLPDHGKGLGKELVQGLPPGEAPLKLGRLGLQLPIGKLFHIAFQGIDLPHNAAQPPELPFIVIEDIPQ